MRYRVGFGLILLFLGYFRRFWVDLGGLGLIGLGSWSRIADEV